MGLLHAQLLGMLQGYNAGAGAERQLTLAELIYINSNGQISEIVDIQAIQRIRAKRAAEEAAATAGKESSENSENSESTSSNSEQSDSEKRAEGTENTDESVASSPPTLLVQIDKQKKMRLRGSKKTETNKTPREILIEVSKAISCFSVP
jgi:hypothetical protein